MRRKVLAGAALAGYLGLGGVAFAAGNTDSVVVGDAAEAWYATTPVANCSSPVGCPPVAPPSANPYPANTLYVAVEGGGEAARSYVQPDLSKLPAGEMAVTGTMTLPLSSAADSGSFNTSTATIIGCLVTQPFPDGTAGSTSSPPGADCTIDAPVKVGSTAFTLNLDPFLAAWNSGAPELGIALVPDVTNATPSTNWQVAFNGRHLAGVPHISAKLAVEPAGSTVNLPTGVSASGSPPPATGVAAPALPGGTLPPPLSAGSLPTAPSISALAPTGQQPLLASPAQAHNPQTAERALILTGGFQYPEALLLPLALLAGVLLMVKLLTGDVTPIRQRS
jgi:hypothetical protein